MELTKNDIIEISIATTEHIKYITDIILLIEKSAEYDGNGIALRSFEYIEKRILEGKAIIAIKENKLVGFCYLETWDHGKYIANSGLVVAPLYRSQGVARKIKKHAFEISQNNYPNAKIFGLTTNLAVMKINSELGYTPVTFSELPRDEEFWKGCETCKYYNILLRTNKDKCLCTGMIYKPINKTINED